MMLCLFSFRTFIDIQHTAYQLIRNYKTARRRQVNYYQRVIIQFQQSQISNKIVRVKQRFESNTRVVGRKFLEALEVTRAAPDRISQLLDASRNLCFARPPSTLVSGVLLYINKRLFLQPLLGALSWPAITTTTMLPDKKPTKNAKKY